MHTTGESFWKMMMTLVINQNSAFSLPLSLAKPRSFERSVVAIPRPSALSLSWLSRASRLSFFFRRHKTQYVGKYENGTKEKDRNGLDGLFSVDRGILSTLGVMCLMDEKRQKFRPSCKAVCCSRVMSSLLKRVCIQSKTISSANNSIKVNNCFSEYTYGP